MKAQRLLHSPLTAIAFAGLAISIIVLARMGSLRTERYFVKQIPITAQVASSRRAGAVEGPDRVLVAVSYTSQGWHGSRLHGAFSKTGEMLGLMTDVPEYLGPATDLLAIDLTGDAKANRVSHLTSVKFSTVPQLVNYDGSLFIIDRGVSSEEMEDEEDGAPVYGAPNGGRKGWRLEQDRLVEMTDREIRSVSESITQPHQRSPLQGQDSTPRNQLPTWKVCTENIYSFKSAGRCPINFGGTTWTVRFNGITTVPLDSPVFVQLGDSNGRETIRLTDDSNLWLETDATSYSALQNHAGPAWRSLSGAHFANGWTSYLFGLLVMLGFPYVIIRSALNRSVNSKPYFPEAKPEDFPGIDRQRLEDYSQFLTANGFKHLRDYTVASSNPSRHRPPSFARVFVHPESRCFAEVAQLFTTQPESAGMRCSFMTAFNGDWRFSTTDRVINPVTYIARRPRSLWLSRPGMSIAELLSLHGQMISQITMRLSLSVVEDVSIEGYFQRSAQAVAELNKNIGRKSVWVFPLIFQYQYQKHRRHYEWLGHYGLKAPADPWIPPDENPDDTSSAGWQRTINRWSPTINVACTAMIGLSAYLVFMHPTHSITSSMFRLSISVLGLSGYAFLAIFKKKSDTA